MIVQWNNAPELADLAIRLHATVANSVASERSFSAMNRQHTKFRNSLLPEKVTKLTYIAMNDPVLRRKEEGKNEVKDLQQHNEALEEELIAIEQAEYERTATAEQFLDVDAFAVEEETDLGMGGKSGKVLGKRPFGLTE